MVDVKKLSDEELEALASQVDAERRGRTSAAAKQTAAYGLTDLESHKDLAVELMSEWWDDDKEAAFVDSLLAKANSTMGDPAYDDVASIVEFMGSASNDRSELESGDDESDEYFEIEQSFEENSKRALSELEDFWKTYVAKPKPKAKKPVKKGK